MSADHWFPINYELSVGLTLYKMIGAGNEWQLYGTSLGSRALVCKPGLKERWTSSGLLGEDSMDEVSLGVMTYYLLESGIDQKLTPISEFISPTSKSDAVAFAMSLKQTRQIIGDASLHDAIYVERLSRLLPTWTVTGKVSDGDVLGCWLTGGVNISTSSFRRLTKLMGWLKSSEVREIVEFAGLEAGSNAGGIRSKSRENEKTHTQFDTEKPSRKKSKSRTRPRASEFRISGRPYLERFFQEHVIDIILNEERYKALGVEFPSAIVLHGPPGCGKTFAIERLVEFLDWPAFHVDASSIGSPYIHETSRKIAEIFERAMEDAPSAIIIDEMESFLSDRQLHQSTGLHHVEEVAEFLRRIPLAVSKRVLVIGMTNRLMMIDPAILRRGRFDHVIEVKMPSREEVAELVATLLCRMPVDEGISTDNAIIALVGRPLSDTAFVIREAGRLAAKAGKDRIDQGSLDTAVGQLPDNIETEKSRPIGFVWK